MPTTTLKKFFGTANYLARLTFAPNRKYYNSKLKVRIEIFDGRNKEGVFDCDNIADVSKKVMNFYREKTGMPLEPRRLALWFIEYLEEVDIVPPTLNELIVDMTSTPEEVKARQPTE
ncbi:MAG: hypothetical protein FK734_18080 [Asgard group archaeon]|nr:hypothetical protein [Asgard group archaeon]